MIRLLGRQTSGNVQKVLFLLEEIGVPYTREDYGRQFNNTQTPEYLALNPNGKVPTLVDGDTVIWESNTILRYLAAKHAPQLTGATPAERTEVERWMDWLLAAVNTPTSRCSRTRRSRRTSAPRLRSRRQGAGRAAHDPRRRSGGQGVVRGQGLHARRHRARADRQALPRIPDRAAGAEQPQGLAREAEGAAGVQEGDGGVGCCTMLATLPSVIMVGLRSDHPRARWAGAER